MDNLKDDLQESDGMKDAGIVIGIERVIELSGARSFIKSYKKIKVLAHIARPLGIKEYAILAIPSGSLLRLGSIDPGSKVFKLLEPKLLCPCGYATNNVVNRIFIYKEHFEAIQTLKEILAIKGIRMMKTKIPTLPRDIKEILGDFKDIYYSQKTTNFKYVTMSLYISACFEEEKGNVKAALILKDYLDKYISILKTYTDFRSNEFEELHLDINEPVENYIRRMETELQRDKILEKVLE